MGDEKKKGKQKNNKKKQKKRKTMKKGKKKEIEVEVVRRSFGVILPDKLVSRNNDKFFFGEKTYDSWVKVEFQSLPGPITQRQTAQWAQMI